MSSMNFAATQSNYSVQQRYQADFAQGQPLQSTLSTGFESASVQNTGFGMQVGNFASSFGGMNLQPFNQANMQRGGVGFGSNIAPFGSMPNPQMEMAYQNRYQMGGAFGGGMTSFRGGVSSQMQTQQLQIPEWMNPASIMAYSPRYQSLEGMAMVRSTNADIANFVQESQQGLAQRVSEMQAAGASPQAIAEHVKLSKAAFDGALKQKRTNAVAEMTQFITQMLQNAHTMAASIISKISA